MYSAPAILSDVVEMLRTDQMDLVYSINYICDVIDKSEPTIQALMPEPGRRERLIREARDLQRRF